MDCSSSLPQTNLRAKHLLFFATLLFTFGTAFKPNRAPSTAVATFSKSEAQQLRQDIAGYAQNFVGIHYVHAGGAPRKGFDCSGFTAYILDEFAVKVSPASSAQSKEGVKIGLNEVQAGDLVFFGRHGRTQHVALVVERKDDGGIVVCHATSSKGIMVEDIMQSAYWRRKLMFARDVITPRTLSE